ncbi:hypothetical protein HOLleu_27964 [Holothuria leucospilota]|uniref:Uncharacterized protein n=1 Tax=Holothuria leucospilota TaxID=206669 RepID=A0A9Q1BRI7_HOLLE|nr:hypothetical protein HOLleu_27964 [Holothuria leucospilota]
MAPKATVWIALMITTLAGYAGAQTTLVVTGTTGVTGTVGTMTTENTTESTGTPSTKPTEPESTTKPTPQPDIPTFKTSDGQGSYCMIISLNAKVTTDEEKEEERKSTKVPSDASVDAFPLDCPKNRSDAYIELSWADDGMDWVLGLMFEAKDDQYTMTTVNVSYTTGYYDFVSLLTKFAFLTINDDRNNFYHVLPTKENGTTGGKPIDDFDFPEVELGHSVHCKDVHIEPYLYFEEYKFQPFAQWSEGGFGEAEDCEGDKDGLDTVWIIVISCAGGVVLLLLLAGVCAFCSKRSKQSSYDKV